jgi:hypothetical protein
MITRTSPTIPIFERTDEVCAGSALLLHKNKQEGLVGRMSVEAISWALNLAPVPRDRGRKRNSACKAVLVGLANHADPDGTAAFPSVHTLVRYTELSERTVRTALDRLEADGVIRPCDPAIVAARIRRADQRPQGWDLAMHLVRDDLDDDDIASLEGQFPGLAARITAIRTEASGRPAGTAQPDPPEERPGGPPAAGRAGTGAGEDGVQRLHPVLVAAVDNVTSGVQPLHPVTGTGCSQRRDGVQPFPQRGAAVAPEPSLEPSREPPAAPARPHEAPAGVDGTGEAAAAGEFFGMLGPPWLLTGRQRRRLTPAVQAALGAGWRPGELARFVAANSGGVRSPYAVLRSRLSPGELPAPPARAVRPPWCGTCNQSNRRLEGPGGSDGGRCPACHPLRATPRPA